ncbi:ATP-binding protein [Pseudomonas sp. RGM 3321]|uniref:ATP-binding protein n=1 Tax=Pseudomonas sp. RGM 3321 TaxID=2930089 RepID=UPI001FCAFE8E|nr:ATP-binding protein [Pseudomonas sp. RGM 3321]MCJ2374023.1 ATP-binding protein [Pseudomonas sp. RGM 3321]
MASRKEGGRPSVKSAEAANGAAAPASPELTAGAGFTFEDGIAAVYATALLAETTAPGVPGRIVRHLAVQQGSSGHPLDDVIVWAEGQDGTRMSLSLQVKRKLVVSASASNTDFKETIQRAHLTLHTDAFRVGIDRVGAVIGEMADASKRDFETLCEWARGDSDPHRFIKKLRAKGVAGNKATYFDIVKVLIAAADPDSDHDVAAHQLLAHFVLMRMEMLHEGSTTEAQAVISLANCLHPTEQPRADDLWRRLLSLVRVAEGVAASFDRKTLVSRLNGTFHLNGAPSLHADIRRIAEESSRARLEVLDTIAGLAISRDTYVEASLDAMQQSKVVLITGLPGTGKSVVLSSLIDRRLTAGPVLFLKADRLAGASWAQYATSIGLSNATLESLMVEIEATGTPVVYIDGIDRLEVDGRRVVLDVMNTIVASPLLQNWRAIATLRDIGMEPVRTWLPALLVQGGVQVVEVSEFNDIEARTLADSVPAMEPLLFGAPQIKAVVRRPFFTSILVRHVGMSHQTMNSEIQLATAWWLAGGYGAESAQAARRQRALLQLAQNGAFQLGKKISSVDVDPDALADLMADGIVRPVRAGLTVKFVHDIYFEWAFLQLLVSQDDRWIDVIRNVGEPPVLGRVIELLSQAELSEGEEWHKHLDILEHTTTIRTQWLRAWLLGPFGLPNFAKYESAYNSAVLQGSTALVGRLAVWFQADKTRPNPLPLNVELFPDLDPLKRWVWSDLMALPSDFSAWRRFCFWLVRHADKLAVSLRPEITSVFEVWQNACAGFQNPVTQAILTQVGSWLESIETVTHSENISFNKGVWDELGYGKIEELESRLRLLVLRAGTAYPALVSAYVDKWAERENLPTNVVSEVFLHAPTLSRVCPDSLVTFALQALQNPLPDAVLEANRNSKSRRLVEQDFGYHDWENLCTDQSHGFFPAAPTREPFHSLFISAPEQARTLVRKLTNHAAEAWRQLHVHSYLRTGTPIPLSLHFPWGECSFQGDGRHYLWGRGVGGPKPIASGLMALEAWAIGQLANGTEPDIVLRDVLEGHTSIAALGIGVAIILESQLLSASSLPLLSNQRLWTWDINRCASETSSALANRIGFEHPDKSHFDAVEVANNRPSRRTDIRWLSSAFVAQRGTLATELAAALQDFPASLPFDYEEERADKALVNKLVRNAEIWAEVGKVENYRFEVAEHGTQVSIQMDNPRVQASDVQEISRKHQEMFEHLRILQWVDTTFEQGAIDVSIGLQEVIAYAKSLDTPDLFVAGHSHISPEYRRQGIVAGVAAIVLTHRSDNEDADWAVDVCDRGVMTPECPEFFVRSSHLMHHPVLYITRGLVALLDESPLGKDAHSLLVRLSAHPYEQICIEAIGGMLRSWNRLPDVAWSALDLAVSLAMTEHHPFAMPQEEKEKLSRARISLLLAKALDGVNSSEREPKELPKIPPAWVPVADEAPLKRTVRGRAVIAEWDYPSVQPDTEWLGKILNYIPLEAVLSDLQRKPLFLAWCDDLVLWTIERVYPSWAIKEGRTDWDEKASDLYVWRRCLFGFLGKLSLFISTEESSKRFVEPAAASSDKVFTSLMVSYQGSLISSLLDEAELSDVPLRLLRLIVSRMIACESFRYSGRYGSLSDSDLSTMVREVFFVEIEKAGGAARFANGNWRELPAVFDVSAPLLNAHGSVAVVADAFVTQCERAFEHYPLDRFAAQLDIVLTHADGVPAGWQDRNLPARIANLIQRFSEKVSPLPCETAQVLLRGLDALVDMGNRRAAAVQVTEAFKTVRIT